jgi:hypothetical protein
MLVLKRVSKHMMAYKQMTGTVNVHVMNEKSSSKTENCVFSTFVVLIVGGWEVPLAA